MEKLNKIFCTSQIPVIDKYTIEHEPISSLDLMERAAETWTDFFENRVNGFTKAVVVAGNGNNGGDGYVIARLLRTVGWDVVVFRLMADQEFSKDCEVNYKRWVKDGGKVKVMTCLEDFQVEPDTIIIDAIFGSGLNRKVTGLAADIIKQMNASQNMIAAVDIPSGLMGEDNTDNDPDAIVRADYTFTFQFPKVAFLLPENADYVGTWEVLDIGLSEEIIAKTETPWYFTTQENIRDILPVSGKFAHKGTNGKGLLIAGSHGMMGAAVLAARAALRSGIGLLYCHVPLKGGDIMQVSVPEAILDLDKSQTCFTGVKAPGQYDAIAVGPALGQGPETAAALKDLLQDRKGVTILDADALNLMAEHRELLECLHEKCILTPHMKEFERLAGKSANDFDRLNKLSNFASRWHVYVILKGANSVIATPQGHFYFNMSGNPGMAKGGAGDVLTGVLLALAANGMDVLQVARIGVFAHGLAADLLAEEYGYRGICSGMIAEAMGKAWKRLENRE